MASWKDRAIPAEDDKDFSSQYNTELLPDEEQKFQTWVQQRSAKQGRDASKDLYDYDLRGAWKSNAREAENGHLPDTYKKPNHPTFSDQSQYNGKDGNVGGTWQEEQGGWSFRPSKTNLDNLGVEGLQKYFKEREPNSKLLLDSPGGKKSWKDRATPADVEEEKVLVTPPGGIGTAVDRATAERMAAQTPGAQISPVPEYIKAADKKAEQEKSVKQQAYERLQARGKFTGNAAQSAGISALDSASLGNLSSTLATQDKLRNATGFTGEGWKEPLPNPLEHPLDFIQGLAMKGMGNQLALSEAITHPIKTYKKWNSGDEDEKAYQAALNKKTAELPYSSFAGGVAGGLLSGPRGAAQAALVPAVSAFNATKGDLADKTFAGGVNGLLGAAGFSQPLGTGAALLGLSNADDQSVLGGMTGMVGGAMNALGRKSQSTYDNAYNELAAPLRAQETETASLRPAAEAFANKGVQKEAQNISRATKQGVKEFGELTDTYNAAQAKPYKELLSAMGELSKENTSADKEFARAFSKQEGGPSGLGVEADPVPNFVKNELYAPTKLMGAMNREIPEAARGGIEMFLPDAEARLIQNAQLAQSLGKDGLRQHLMQKYAPQMVEVVGPDGLSTAMAPAEPTVIRPPSGAERMDMKAAAPRFNMSPEEARALWDQLNGPQDRALVKYPEGGPVPKRLSSNVVADIVEQDLPNVIFKSPEQAKALYDLLGITPKTPDQVIDNLAPVGGGARSVGPEAGTNAGGRSMPGPKGLKDAPVETDGLPDYEERIANPNVDGDLVDQGQGIPRDQFSKLKQVPDLEGALPEKPTSPKPFSDADQLREYLIQKYIEKKAPEGLTAPVDQLVQQKISESPDLFKNIWELYTNRNKGMNLIPAISSAVNSPETRAKLGQAGTSATGQNIQFGQRLAGQGVSQAELEEILKKISAR